MTLTAFEIKKSDHLSAEFAGHAMQSRIFSDWAAALRTKVTTCTIDAVDFRGKPSAETVMFARLKVRTPEKPYDQIVQLRGNAVGLLVVLSCEGELYTLLTEQVRLPAGGMLAELPAGMVDGGTFTGAAAKEIQEETGLSFGEADLIPLSRDPIYLSPGLLDEGMHFFAVVRSVSRTDLDALIDKTTGAKDEHEHITLKVVPLSEMLDAVPRDGKAHIALLLYRLLFTLM